MSAHEVALGIADDAWRDSFPEIEDICRRAVLAALEAGGGHTAVEVSLLLADDARVRALNRDHRGRDRPTNVLSFPGDPEPTASGQLPLLGDVVLALETCLREARVEGKPAAHHISHLIVHGVLHLLGYDHQNPGEAAEMEGLEVRILSDLGIADPYRLPQND